MKTTLALTISCMLSVTLLAQQPAAPKDSINTVQVAPLDSLSTPQKGWKIRTPLTPEEKQRRADNRAEVESMKARFRAYHQSAASRRAEEATEAQEGDYLWGEAETGGAVQSKGADANPKTPAANTEELRMEIGRNLQEGRSISAPTSPVRPTYSAEEVPANYDHRASPPPTGTDWESDIRSALQQEEPPVNNEWQARTGAVTTSLVNPRTGEPLQAGQTLILEQVRFSALDTTLSPATQRVLHQWGQILRQHPQLVVQVRAHTHSGIASFEAQQLTNQRAAAIVQFWQMQGVATPQVSYRGYGRLSPLVSSADPLAQQKNERIELVILEMP